MLEKVPIKKTGNPDEGYDDIDDLFLDTLQHCDDVENVMKHIASHIEDIGEYHDYTKIENFEDYANDTLERQITPNFKERKWYNIHTTNERHHINSNIHDDVNLFDLLEFICDCITAGKARTGKVNKSFLKIDEEILNKCYWNTIKLIDESVYVIDSNK